MKPKLKVFAAAVVAAGTVAGVAAAASSPSVVTGSTSAVHSTSVVLHGTVNPNGRSTTYYFQWGLTNAYGAVSASHSAGAGTKAAAVHVTATQLIPGTRYHYRLVATNGSGQSVGTDHTFKTAGHPPPGVATGPASGVSSTTATLTGVVNPNGVTTTYEFQFGLTTAYGMQTTAATLTAGSVPVPVAQTVTGLTPGTVFHYRLVALHGATVSSPGIDGVLMTFPSKRPKAGITVHTKPGTDRRRPYSFTTSGNINRRNIPGHVCLQRPGHRQVLQRPQACWHVPDPAGRQLHLLGQEHVPQAAQGGPGQRTGPPDRCRSDMEETATWRP